jgi:plastocyanin domain-containing protein
VPRGKPVILSFERTTDRTCATEVVFRLGGKRTETKLPLGRKVEIPLTFSTVGQITYACAMDMVVGTITVR